MGLEDDMKKLKKLQQEQAAKAKKAKKDNVTDFPIEGFIVNKDGNIKANSITNIGLILQRDPLLAGKIAFNEFTYEIELLEDIPKLMLEKGLIDDDYPPALLGYIENKYHVMFPEKLLQGAMVNIARRNVFNPVLDYFESCEQKYDGQLRIDIFLSDYLGAPRTPTTALEAEIFMIGAVAKTYEPEMKFDYVLDLVGGQGVGKTTLLKKISNGWYSDQFTDFENKDNYANMLRALIINDDEMTASNNSSFEILKKFISSETLEFRKPYGHATVRRYENFVMARTTNEIAYLKDKTGERRFMPVLANKTLQKKSPMTDDLNQDYIDQLWGEATTMYRQGFDFLLDDDQEALLAKNREDFMYIDAEEDAIDRALQTWNDDFITSTDICDKIGGGNLVGNRQLARKIKYVMDNKKDWKPGQKRIGNISKRGYRRK